MEPNCTRTTTLILSQLVREIEFYSPETWLAFVMSENLVFCSTDYEVNQPRSFEPSIHGIIGVQIKPKSCLIICSSNNYCILCRIYASSPCCRLAQRHHHHQHRISTALDWKDSNASPINRCAHQIHHSIQSHSAQSLEKNINWIELELLRHSMQHLKGMVKNDETRIRCHMLWKPHVIRLLFMLCISSGWMEARRTRKPKKENKCWQGRWRSNENAVM